MAVLDGLEGVPAGTVTELKPTGWVVTVVWACKAPMAASAPRMIVLIFFIVGCDCWSMMESA
jgi:hypothetical protein